MSVPSAFVRVAKLGGTRKEMRVPITLLPTALEKTIATTALLDTGAMATYISLRFAQQHNIPTYPLTKPFNTRVANGTIAYKVTDFCLLYVQMDRRVMLGKFNVMPLGEREDIIKGCTRCEAV